MKSFEQFLKEEADIRRSSGVPSDFTSKSEEQARRGLGIRPDDERGEMPRIFPEFDQNMRQSNQILRTGPDGRQLSQVQLQERIKKLEELAEKVVREEFEELLQTGVKPVELEIKLVPQGNVSSELSDIRDVQQQSQQPTPQQQQEQDERDRQNRESEEESEEQPDLGGFEMDEDEEEVPGTNLADAIDKKKILNMLTQAAGKSAKDIIRYSELVEQELEEIFGPQSQQILNCWIRMSDLADKMDWVIPVERKAGMMKNMPGGMAGACKVIWESHSGEFYNIGLILEKEANKIVIKSVGIDFPMLIHETIKGVYLFLQSGAIKKDKETAKIIKKATSSFSDEAQDFRYGPPALEMLLKFVGKFPESDEYKRLDARIYTVLAADKERSIESAKKAKEAAIEAEKKAQSSGDIEDEYTAEDLLKNAEYLQKKAKVSRTDKEFLEIMKSMFSTFDLSGSDFVLNEDRFNESLAKTEIQKIIDFIVDHIESYKRELEEWEREQQQMQDELRHRQETMPEEESDIDKLVRQSLSSTTDDSDEEEEKPYDKMTIAEIQREIEKAVEEENYELAGELTNKYLKGESKKVWQNELNRINESLLGRKRNR